MTTAYNVRSKLLQNISSKCAVIADPGDGGTISISADDSYCVLTGGTTRTLKAAASVPVGAKILLISQTSTITVNSSVALSDGEWARFVVVLDSSGANVWASDTDIDAVNALEAYLERAVVQAIPYTNFRVFDAQTTALPVYADDDSDDIQIGVATIGTTAPTFAVGVTNATVTKNAVVNAVVPNDYVAGSAISISVPWTRTDAATTSSAIDLVAYRHAAPTVDICATAAQSINGAASGTATFVLTPTNVVPGETILLHFTVAVVDGTTSRQDLTSINWSYTPAVAGL